MEKANKQLSVVYCTPNLRSVFNPAQERRSPVWSACLLPCQKKRGGTERSGAKTTKWRYHQRYRLKVNKASRLSRPQLGLERLRRIFVSHFFFFWWKPINHTLARLCQLVKTRKNSWPWSICYAGLELLCSIHNLFISFTKSGRKNVHYSICWWSCDRQHRFSSKLAVDSRTAECELTSQLTTVALNSIWLAKLGGTVVQRLAPLSRVWFQPRPFFVEQSNAWILFRYSGLA